MNLLLFLNCDKHAAKALALLAPALRRHEVKIILSQKVGNVAQLAGGLIDLKNFESEGALALFEGLAADLGAQILNYKNVNSVEALADFAAFGCDLIISIRFGQIFKPALIGLPRLGVLNLHSGILPNYRGVLATFWAILRGEKEIGTTLHYITDAGIDTGEIIKISRQKIDETSSLFANIHGLYDDGCKMILSAIDQLAKGEKILGQNQDECENSGYFSYPNEEQVKDFLLKMPLF